jgi:hypothetical protein
MTYVRNPISPLIGIRLETVEYVQCPANDETMGPIKECFGCDLFDHTRFENGAVFCNYPDHNRYLEAAFRNREQIIDAVIRGAGEWTRCDALGRVYEIDRPMVPGSDDGSARD